MILFLYALQTCYWIVLSVYSEDENNCTAAIDLGTIALGLQSKNSALNTCRSMITSREL